MFAGNTTARAAQAPIFIGQPTATAGPPRTRAQKVDSGDPERRVIIDTSPFRCRIRANLRLMGELTKKRGENRSKKCWKMAENGAFSRAQSAISPFRGDRRRSQLVSPADVTSVEPGCLERRLARQIGRGRQFSRAGARNDICRTGEI